MKRFDYVEAFYKAMHNRDTFVADVDALLGSTPRKIRVTSVPFSTDLKPMSAFPIVKTNSRNVRMLTTYEGAQLYDLRYSYKTGTRRQTEEGRFLVYEHPSYQNVFVAVTIEDGQFVRKGLMPNAIDRRRRELR